MCARHRRAPRGRPRHSIPQAFPDDLYDYANDPTPAERLPRREPSPHIFDIEKLPIIDDWPERVPVTEAEIDIFERYFGDVLDRLFGPVDADPGNDSLPPLTSNGNSKS
ncbi:MAG: hypothetical protein ACOYJQ_16365 [Pseudochelatococcus sp.]|jgi:hypothetical protein|uniref:hypothetical protein n=1 Tax=Pseudochelatococcus sp. TaxID=2020869 RepID=UPI003D8EC3DA